MPFTHIRAEGKAGRMGERLMAIVAEGAKGRVYLSPLPEHEAIARKVLPPEAPELDQELPNNPRDFKTPNYGMARWKDLFTPRQLVALTTFSDLVGKAREKVLADAKAHWFGEHARRPPPRRRRPRPHRLRRHGCDASRRNRVKVYCISLQPGRLASEGAKDRSGIWAPSHPHGLGFSRVPAICGRGR